MKEPLDPKWQKDYSKNDTSKINWSIRTEE